MSKTNFVIDLKTYLQLGKFRISIPVALTGFLGYYRVTGRFDSGFILTFFGILLMSMGASTFNQVQERNFDRRMQRTADRPIPAGKISLSRAIIFGSFVSLSGLAFLITTGSLLAAGIGLLTLFWYNLIYTPLKRITPFAVVPGALIGALPPMIGWAAGGGNLSDPGILLISFFLFIGQMPHYWLLLMKVGDEFKLAGFPVITDLFSHLQLRNISFAWITAAAFSALVFPASGIMYSKFITYLLIILVLLFLIQIAMLSFRGEIMQNWRKSFITVNIFYLMVILILIADKMSELYIYSSI